MRLPNTDSRSLSSIPSSSSHRPVFVHATRARPELDMEDFHLSPREYENMPGFLATRAPGFVESKEYQAISQAESIPGIVIALFGEYFLRLQKTLLSIDRDQAVQGKVKECYKIIEYMASSKDPEVRNALITEIFHQRDPTDLQLREEVSKHLQTNSRVRYEKWMT